MGVKFNQSMKLSHSVLHRNMVIQEGHPYLKTADWVVAGGGGREDISEVGHSQWACYWLFALPDG